MVDQGPRRDLTAPLGSLPDLPVAKLHMYLHMAALAQRHQIAFRMGAALRQRFDVMDFLHRNIPSFFKTHLA